MFKGISTLRWLSILTTFRCLEYLWFFSHNICYFTFSRVNGWVFILLYLLFLGVFSFKSLDRSSCKFGYISCMLITHQKRTYRCFCLFCKISGPLSNVISVTSFQLPRFFSSWIHQKLCGNTTVCIPFLFFL